MGEFLVELLSEEIPARMQARAIEDLQRLLGAELAKAQLAFSEMTGYVTPRRLTVVIDGLPDRQPDLREERKGPRVGAPDGAIQGFLRAAGLASIDDAQIQESDKGPYYIAVRERPGQPTGDALAAVLTAAISGLPWPKSMRWRTTEMRWVRPLHNILAIFNGVPLPLALPLGRVANPHGEAGAEAMTLVANAQTTGHRFLAARPFVVRGFAEYRTGLAAAFVRIDPGERRELIAAEAARLAAERGLTVRPDPALLDEVTGLVEWPVVRIGAIDRAFMGVPPEVLITAMRAHQKYFALLDAGGQLAANFVVVANTPGVEDGAAIVAGNERVLRARLSDARYFWDQDRKRPLAERVARLDERVFHAKLGSDRQRTARLVTLARTLAPTTGADAQQAARAALLCKADLTALMVGEFPELQGIMGRYYARGDGEADAVAEAIAEHYAPQGPGDRCPSAPVSVAVALADKLDTLVGFFAVGERPTGSGDPFALRRACLGVIRLIVENRLRLSLRPVLSRAIVAYREGEASPAEVRDRFAAIDAGALVEDLLGFFADRLKVHLRDRGIRHDLISAVLARGTEDDLVRLLDRVAALKDFLQSDDGANVLVAYRRASNIVRIEENKDGRAYQGQAEETLLREEPEMQLHRSLTEAGSRITDAVAAERFHDAMAIVASLRGPVDRFFDQVTVNAPDAGLRANRLRLLAQIRTALDGVADFSLIEG